MVVTPQSVSLGATIFMLLPMFYFLIASLTFFLRGFDDQVVTWMLRGLFNVYFILVIIGTSLAALAFLVAGRPAVAAGIAVPLVCAIAARRWFLAQMDAGIRAREAGDPAAVRAMRGLHLRGIVYHTVQFVAVVACVPVVFGAG